MGRPEEQSPDLYGQHDNGDNFAAETASHYEISNNATTSTDQKPPPYGQPPNPPPSALYQQQPPPPRPAQYPPQMNPPPPESYPPQKPPPPSPSAFPPQIPPPPASFPPHQPASYPPGQQYPPQASPQPNYHHVQQFPPSQPNYGQVPQSPMKQTAQGIPMGVGAAVNTGLWNTGLFDCMDDPTNAAITFLFPCLTFGQIAELIDNGQTSCATGAILYALITSFIGLPCIYSCTYRTKLRSKFGLVEAPAPDWLVHFVCEPCALCQAYRELTIRGLDPAIGWIGNVTRSQQQVMMAPPPNQTMYNN